MEVLARKGDSGAGFRVAVQSRLRCSLLQNLRTTITLLLCFYYYKYNNYLYLAAGNLRSYTQAPASQPACLRHMAAANSQP